MRTNKDQVKQDRHDTEWVLSTVQGRRFLWRILGHCGIYRAMEGSTENILKQEGQRQVGLHLLALISDASEDRLFDMMKEAKNKALEEKIEHERSSRDNADDDYSGGSYTATDALDAILGDLPTSGNAGIF